MLAHSAGEFEQQLDLLRLDDPLGLMRHRSGERILFGGQWWIGFNSLMFAVVGFCESSFASHWRRLTRELHPRRNACHSFDRTIEERTPGRGCGCASAGFGDASRGRLTLLEVTLDRLRPAWPR